MAEIGAFGESAINLPVAQGRSHWMPNVVVCLGGTLYNDNEGGPTRCKA